jgi:hypothetical protein
MAINDVLLGLVATFMIIHGFVLLAPATVEDMTGLNTTALQDSTDYSSNIDTDANVTTGPNVVEQAKGLLDYLTGNSFQNFWLVALNFFTAVTLIVWAVTVIWIG